MEKIEGNSLDLVKLNIAKLKELFPTIVVDGKIDFEILKQLLGDEIEESKEKYQFVWPGKAEAIKLAQLPSSTTLRPDKDSSKNWEKKENIYIEGENLEVLKQLQKTYYNKIKMIYIDPPYNTGNDFVYEDSFDESIKNYKNQTFQGMSSNPNTAGRFHSKWLNHIYPRLILAKNLLKQDGIIFISIDDNEIYNLIKVCNDVFGENNKIAILPTVLNLKGNNDQFGFAGTHEYTLVYAKNIEFLDDLNGIPLEKEDVESYNQEDSFGKYKRGATLMRTGEAGFRHKRPKGYYPIYVSKDLTSLSIYKESDDDIVVYPKTKEGIEMSWRRSPDNLQNTRTEFDIIKTANGISFYKKQRLQDDMKRGKKPKTLFYKSEYSSSNGTQLIKNLFGFRAFDNPKPLQLIEDFIQIGTSDDDIVMDFYGGSSTVAHACFDLNVKFSTNRKFILVQLPENIEDKNEAKNHGFNNICEIGKKRIDLSGEDIKKKWNIDNTGTSLFYENKEFPYDIGFIVIKLASTNIKPWDNETQLDSQSLFDLSDVFKDERSKEDVLYEIMLKYGVFDMQTTEIEVNGKTMYRVGKRYMVVCLEDNVTSKDIEAIGELSPRTVIFKESGFTNDNDKINAVYNLEKAGVEDVKCI